MGGGCYKALAHFFDTPDWCRENGFRAGARGQITHLNSRPWPTPCPILPEPIILETAWMGALFEKARKILEILFFDANNQHSKQFTDIDSHILTGDWIANSERLQLLRR